jgi:hypothetical protein
MAHVSQLLFVRQGFCTLKKRIPSPADASRDPSKGPKVRDLTSLACTVVLLALTACGPAKNGNAHASDFAPVSNSSTATGAGALNYELTEATCSTGPRAYGYLKDLCLNLQVDANNNSCATTKRMAAFAQMCPGQIYDAAKAARTLLHATGMYLSCDFTTVDTATNKTIVAHQETSGISLRFKAGTSTVTAQQSLRAGYYALSLSITSADTTATASQSKAWQDSAPDVLTINAASKSTALSLICTPSIQTLSTDTSQAPPK